LHLRARSIQEKQPTRSLIGSLARSPRKRWRPVRGHKFKASLIDDYLRNNNCCKLSEAISETLDQQNSLVIISCALIAF
jgi:hypothetical protein